MEPHDAIDLGREAILMTLKISAPVLIVGMVVGLLIGLGQALTQIQEQTIAIVPKIVLMILGLSICLPWLVAHMLEYTRDLIANIPGTLG
jgi:flagellar biosynthetic protein FliQ